MRILFVFAALLAAGHSLFATTFVLKSGKKIEGRILYEDLETVRIRDSAGTRMSIRKSLLDQESTAAANVREVQIAIQINPDIPKSSRSTLPRQTYSRVPAIPVLQNGDGHDWERQLRTAQREYNRLTQACKSAGGGPSRGVLRTVTYMVHGKPVRITGYWANPADIENAKRVCKRAMEAEQNWFSAKQEWEEFQRSAHTVSSLSTTAK